MALFQFSYNVYNSTDDLSNTHQQLITEARQVLQRAYAPYSGFSVGAAVLLANGKIIPGVNIENASYPVGICAERSALASAISSFPDEKILAIAISYLSPTGKNDVPVFPCGMCRQFIAECEDRNHAAITLLLAGATGEIYIIDSAKHLLPFSFGRNQL